jgi:hypothetical protein
VPSRGTPRGVTEDEANRKEVGAGGFAARSGRSAVAIESSGAVEARVPTSFSPAAGRERETEVSRERINLCHDTSVR